MTDEEYPEEKKIEPEELNSCDKSESDLDTDKARIRADPNAEVIYCGHCGRWIDGDQWEEVDMSEQMTGASK